MTYRISTTQIDPGNGRTHLEHLTFLATSLNWSEFYSKIFEYTASPDDDGNVADPNVREWFSVASQANAGLGAPSDLIRDYTAAQVTIRTGSPLSSTALDEASDAIAESIWLTSISRGDLPTLADIRTEDARNVVNVLQANSHNVGFEVWSGNLLFVGLGDTVPLTTNLIQPTSTSSYDLFAAGQALNAAGLGSLLGAGVGSALTFISNTGSVLTANSEMNSFLSRLYGDFAPTAVGAVWNAQVGRQDNSSDLLAGTGSQDAINSGAGDDIIVGSLGIDLLDGGAGFDFADFGGSFESYFLDLSNQAIGSYSGEVSYSGSIFTPELLSDTVSHLFNIEALRLGRNDDILRLENFPTLQRIDGGGSFEKGNLLDLSPLVNAVNVSLAGPINSVGMVDFNSASLEIANFDNVVASRNDDVIAGSDSRNLLFAAAGNDSVDGAGGHDDIFGGLGNDTIFGGAGADFIYDNGAEAPIDEGDSSIVFSNQLLTYDPNGHDFVDGGAGSDVIFYSGGTDTIVGGPGNDIYLTAAEMSGTRGAQDDLTIILSENASDPSSWFGNDLILGDGRGIDRVRFEGISSSEVTISYSYKEVFVGSSVVEQIPNLWWAGILSSVRTYDHYQTVGAYEIRVNSTGSSLVIENVFGTHVRGDNPSAVVGAIEASMVVPFFVEFDDGIMSWPDNVLDANNDFYTFENSQLGQNAFAALGAAQRERDQVENEIEGNDNDEDIFGDIAADSIRGNGGDDRLFGGGGNDRLIGGSGADFLSGGTGIDTASYTDAASRVGVYLDPDRFTIRSEAGDAVGDTFDSIENLIGSDFDDNLNGDQKSNLIDGGAGNDVIRGLGGLDTLIGGSGDDSLRSGEYISDGGFLVISDHEMHGGTGNDTIRSSSGNDLIFGDAGDDLIELSNYINFTSPGTPGNDTVDGGSGFDTVHFFNGAISVDLGAGFAAYAGTDEEVRLINVEGVIGSREDDLIIGCDSDNIIDGDGGNDTLVGGGGNDDIYADRFSFSDDAVIFGGSGIDTAHVIWNETDVTVELIDGGLKISRSFGSASYTIYDDVEFIQFADRQRSFQDLAAGLVTEFAVIDDYIRVDEGVTASLELLANDLEFNSNPITVQSVNGIVADPGSIIRLASGASIVVESDGTLTLDQGGAYAWLDADESQLTELTYTATDSTNVSRTATATLIVDGVDTPSNRIHLDRDVYITETNPTAADALWIGNFNVNRTILIVDEEYIDPNNAPVGYTVQEISGNTFVTYGSDDAIVLEGIALGTWQYAVSNQTVGTDASETITGSIGDDAIQARAGDDLVRAGAGDDVVVGGDGNDTLEFSAGNNVALGGDGNDTIDGFGSGANLFYGGAGSDRLVGGDDKDTLNGGSGDDLIQGIDGDDLLYGDTGNDTLFGGAGIDFFDGGDGFDELELQNEYPNSFPPGLIVNMRLGYFGWADSSFGIERFENIEKIVGASGHDLMIGSDGGVWLDGVGGNDTTYGGAGDDTLTGVAGNNEMYGDAGDDIISSSSSGNELFDGGDGNDQFYTGSAFGTSLGEDTIIGGAGIDELRIGNSFFATTFDLVSGIVQTGSFTSQIQGVENVEGGGNDDVFFGDSISNRFVGGGGDDFVLGEGGDDSLLGGTGEDTLNGGVGNDEIDGGAGNDTAYGGDGHDLVQGGDGDDLLIGNEGSDTIEGGAGFNDLRGRQGDDSIIAGDDGNIGFGGDGNDTMIGGSGSDTLQGNGGSDSILGGDGNDILFGQLGTDTVLGEAGDDEVFGGDGNDSVAGGTGNDTLFGGTGADTMIGGDGADVIRGNQQADMVTGDAGNDSLFGDDGFDTLDGGDGADNLQGGNGQDLIIGGLGQDVLTGGAQADTFQFRTVVESAFGAADSINDMTGVGLPSGDIIDLSLIDGDVSVGGDQAFTFLGEVSTSTGLAGGAGTLWVENFGGQTRVYGIVDNDGTIDFALRLNDGTVLAGDYTEADFLL